MLYLVIERYKDRNAKAIYKRASEQGRMLPEGLRYIDSWVETNFDRCFQLMETEDPTLFNAWIAEWSDLVDFEVVPVMTSKQAFAMMQT
ncbi:MAG: DUF3303 domain-containing protein [Deltaproteobacteria bacterium]|nr:MAG: DUF3303 domain-containing protein [Deltaproteobacteria bacterium]